MAKAKGGIRDKIAKWVGQWASTFALHNWDIEVQFKAFSKTGGEIGGGVDFVPEHALAYCSADPQYLLATIVFNSERLDDITETVIVHELIHCIQSELDEFSLGALSDKEVNHRRYDYYRERQVSELERIIMRIHVGKK